MNRTAPATTEATAATIALHALVGSLLVLALALDVLL